MPSVGCGTAVLSSRQFLVDTGNNDYVTVSQEIANVLLRSGRAASALSQDTAEPGTMIIAKQIIVEEIEIAGVRFQNVPTRIANVNGIGMPLLSRFNVAFDFPNQQILFAESPDAALAEFPVNASGMGVIYVSTSSLKVIRIRERSSAAKAGIRPEDFVISIDGHRPADLSFHDVQVLLSPGRQDDPRCPES